MKQKQCGKKIIFVAAAVILCVFAGLFLLQRKEPSTKGQGDKIYRWQTYMLPCMKPTKKK